MTATQTIDRDLLARTRTLMDDLRTTLKALKIIAESTPSTREADDALAVASVEVFSKGFRLVDPLCDGIEELLNEIDRLKSMAAHPAGKGRCRCISGAHSV